ncbi:acyl CoA binding protein-domain-containing protein [Exophiala viscosa]|uniref:Acyl CoA binding protein-domain-containing protein n=1 Tax=Exophiala viscosa TaxID=2486360 RepID=A0AAN6E2G1_9EURO|nr:acyl CoA binding protein-domain-containing protein [Exophiala viscosa]KAI1619514.1 acyl CoA binding protein-domain-containing protein [Exophiala viscosa]
MSDSVDRVFVHALATVRRLPRTGSSRPPPSARLRLYGLYKQSMEGDVESILPRPTLPTVSPDPNSSKSNNVHRYASRDLRMREAEAEIEKWDAWHSCAGMSRTEAKRRYISTLIETMKEYASGTQEARELVAELEFVWNQIKSQSGSSEDEDVDSPTRRLERAGLGQTQSFGSIPPGQSSRGSEGLTRLQSASNQLRVLSPVSQRASDDVVEGEEVDPDSGALVGPLPTTQTPVSEPEWRTRMQELLRHLSNEVAALREQLSANHLLSSSSLSPSLTTRRRKVFYRISAFAKWLSWIIVRQIMLDAGLILAFILWARWKGYKERTVEDWVKRRWNDLRRGLSDLDTWLRGTLVEVRIPGVPKVF